MAALTDLQQRKRYNEALALVDRFSPLFSRAEQLELRGGTLEQWGTFLLSQQTDDNPSAHRDRSAGLQRFRAAGVAFEELAELRFATKSYTTDLWRGARILFKDKASRARCECWTSISNTSPSCETRKRFCD